MGWKDTAPPSLMCRSRACRLVRSEDGQPPMCELRAEHDQTLLFCRLVVDVSTRR